MMSLLPTVLSCHWMQHVTDVQRKEKHIWTNLSVEFHMVKSYSECGLAVFSSVSVFSLNATQCNEK